jgi:hypothetical protein
VTIDVLPDVVLLEIFDSYVDEARIEAWHRLVHVCRKWRIVTFGSPRRLNLRLHCKASTPVRKTLDVWPLLPIVIRVYGQETWGGDNIVAAIEHNDRICELDLFDIPSSRLEKVLAAMQQPFSTLTRLQLQPRGEAAPVVPTSFLGGSAPCLQTLFLNRIQVPFPGLTKLLLSATRLVDLYLFRISYSGYISPEALVTCLAVLTRLETLHIGFESTRCHPDRTSRRPPLPTRTLLPILTKLWFKGVGNYLEDLVAQIDAPLLDKFSITFFHQLIYDTPQLTQFIGRTPKLKARDEARVVFHDWNVSVTLPQIADGVLELEISCRRSDWQLSSLAEVCSFSFPQALTFAVEHLYIQSGTWQLHWQDDIENSQWLEIFQPFTAVKNLYISSVFTRCVVHALRELVGERVAEVLPALQTLFLEETLLFKLGPVQETIGQFLAARQLSGHPVTVSRWVRMFED